MTTAVTKVIGVLMALFQLSSLSTPQPERHKACSATTRAVTEVALCKAAQQLGEVIGTIQPGTCVHYATAGAWSMHDLVLHIIAQIGPAHVTVATWSISEPAVRQIVRAIGDGRILSLGLLADWRVPTRCPEALQLAKANAATCRLSSIHAKVAVLHGAAFPVCIVGSGNLTNNPRIEAGVIAADAIAAAFHRDWIRREIARAHPFDMSDKPAHGSADDE